MIMQSISSGAHALSKLVFVELVLTLFLSQFESFRENQLLLLFASS